MIKTKITLVDAIERIDRHLNLVHQFMAEGLTIDWAIRKAEKILKQERKSGAEKQIFGAKQQIPAPGQCD